MIGVLELILVFVVLPVGLAWAARRYGRVQNGFIAAAVVVVSAGIPALLIFYMTQQADAITRAASVMVTPVLFLLLLIPAGAGYAMGRPKKLP